MYNEYERRSVTVTLVTFDGLRRAQWLDGGRFPHSDGYRLRRHGVGKGS